MTAEQRATGPVLLTEDGAVDIVETVARYQPVPTGGASEALNGWTGGKGKPSVRTDENLQFKLISQLFPKEMSD